MITFIHVVGAHGIGKSSLIASMAAYRPLGSILEWEGQVATRAEAVAMAKASGAQTVFVEWLKRSDVVAEPGEMVITMENYSGNCVRDGSAILAANQ